MEDVKDLSIKLEKFHKYMPQYNVEITKNGKRIYRTNRSCFYRSVGVVIFNTTRQKLVLIKQFRLDHMFASIREDFSGFRVDDHQKMEEIVCKSSRKFFEY